MTPKIHWDVRQIIFSVAVARHLALIFSYCYVMVVLHLYVLFINLCRHTISYSVACGLEDANLMLTTSCQILNALMSVQFYRCLVSFILMEIQQFTTPLFGWHRSCS